MTPYQLRVRHHGANAISRWVHRHHALRPLSNFYYFVVRRLLTHYVRSDDGGRTWRRVA